MNSKRAFVALVLRAACVGIGAVIALPRRSAGQGEREGDKLSKAQAQYQDTPKGIQSCATCTLFVAPHGCKVVDGEVSPDGWCKAYAMAD